MLELEPLGKKLGSQGSPWNNVKKFSMRQLNSSGPVPTTIHERGYACGKRLFAQLQFAQQRRIIRRVAYVPVFVAQVEVELVSPLRIFLRKVLRGLSKCVAFGRPNGTAR